MLWMGKQRQTLYCLPSLFFSLSLSVFLPHTCCESDIKTLANLAWKCHKNAAAASLARIADIVSFKLNLMGRTRPHLLLVVSSFRWQDDLASASASRKAEKRWKRKGQERLEINFPLCLSRRRAHNEPICNAAPESSDVVAAPLPQLPLPRLPLLLLLV